MQNVEFAAVYHLLSKIALPRLLATASGIGGVPAKVISQD